MSMNGYFDRGRGCSGTTRVDFGSYSSKPIVAACCASARGATAAMRTKIHFISVNGDRNRRFGVLPGKRQRSRFRRARLQTDGERLDRCRERLHVHLDASEVFGLVVVRAPLAG